jgi:hypothetical protein
MLLLNRCEASSSPCEGKRFSTRQDQAIHSLHGKKRCTATVVNSGRTIDEQNVTFDEKMYFSFENHWIFENECHIFMANARVKP